MKKYFFVLLVLSVLLILSGCQSEMTYYRMFNDHKYIETRDDFYEYEASWMRIESISGGYKIIYSGTSIYTEVINYESVVYGLTCQVSRNNFGSIQSDCSEEDRLQLMPYFEATVIYEGSSTSSSGAKGNIAVYVGLLLIALAIDIFFGLMALYRPFLEAIYQFKASLQVRYKDQPEYSELYLDSVAIGYIIFFIIMSVGIVVLTVMLFIL